LHSDLTLLESVKLGKIWDFPGGVHPPERKHLSNGTAISKSPMPEELYVPLKQHIGEQGELIVEKGQTVKKGQPLTKPANGLSLPVHAPTSGTVKDVVMHVSAHPSGITEPTLILTTDGNDEWADLSPLDKWQQQDKQSISDFLQRMGIAGLGGATFPTYVKTNAKHDIDVLIINAVECEPYITSDDVLMREHAEQIIAGCQILLHTVNAKIALIGIEDNKPEAIEAMKNACNNIDNIEVRVVPTKYPSGGEKQLIQLLTNKQVPSGGIPADIGILVQNVGTAYAIEQAVTHGRPLVERVVTVTGESISNPQNLWVPFGTSVKHLLDHAGITPDKNQRVIMGGPMMGFNILDALTPVVKATNCILAAGEYYLPMRSQEQACIRCGDCAAACPAELLPQQMLWYSKAKDQDKLKEYNLFDCIECGACAYVCPSEIPLVQYYRNSKAEIRQADEDKVKADKAKIRFEQRQERLEREKEERLQRHKEAAERRRNAMAKDDSAKDKIAAALARAKAKKQEQAAAPESDEPKDKVAAAIARAKAKKQAQAETKPEAVDDNKSKVAEAIARAKAKKLAKQAESEGKTAEVTNTDTAEEKTPEQLKKEKVAAAIAKAKAKKQAQQGPAETEPETPVETANKADAVEEKTPEQIKKEKVAAAIAKAKAKKQAQQGPAETEPETPVETANKADAVEEKTPEQIKKEKVAAAIAKAKAKKQAQQEPAETEAETLVETADSDDVVEEKTAEQIKKEKVAAAIAKAKARKAEKEAQQAGKED
jgi:electron transport complex protein RnfC